MVLTSTGLGIGTTSPADNLTVYGTNPAASAIPHLVARTIFFRDSGGAQGSIDDTRTLTTVWRFLLLACERLRVDSSGRVMLIDTSDSSDSLLIVQGNAGDC